MLDGIVHASEVGRRWCCEPVWEYDRVIRRAPPSVAFDEESTQRRLPLEPDHQARASIGWVTARRDVMEIRHTHCCGLDIHRRSVTACLLTPGDGAQPIKQIRTFGTMTADLLALGDWLAAAGCTHVAMESTGVYWQPLYNLLEDEFTLLLVNAQHYQGVPGRKTDVGDAEWLADLLRHGLVRGSFVPPKPQRELRDLTRYRTQLVRERASELNRLQQTLTRANIQLAAVASDVLGVSGRAMVEALVAGADEPAALADLARGQLRQKLPALERALRGRVGAHERFLLRQHLQHIDYLSTSIAEVSAEIAERLRPFAAELERLQTIPGVGRTTAEVLLAEIGTDMTRFPSAAHLASWAGVCPGNHESAGKRLSGRVRNGDPWLRTALTEAAQAAGHSRQTYLAAQYHRLAARRGKKRAVLAVAHSILVIAYQLLARGTSYDDLGPAYFDERERTAREHRLIQQLERLGNRVTLERVDEVALAATPV
jgi:transposase